MDPLILYNANFGMNRGEKTCFERLGSYEFFVVVVVLFFQSCYHEMTNGAMSYSTCTCDLIRHQTTESYEDFRLHVICAHSLFSVWRLVRLFCLPIVLARVFVRQDTANHIFKWIVILFPFSA